MARNSNNISATYKNLVSGKIVFRLHIRSIYLLDRINVFRDVSNFSIFCWAKGKGFLSASLEVCTSLKGRSQ